MSINISIPTTAYADFKIIVGSLRNKGNVYYYDNAPITWGVFFASDDGAFAVQLVGGTGSFPASFSTDFPAAVQLTVSQPTFQV